MKLAIISSILAIKLMGQEEFRRKCLVFIFSTSLLDFIISEFPQYAQVIRVLLLDVGL